MTPTTTLQSLFNDFTSHNMEDTSPINCDYYDLSSKIPFSNKSKHSMFHLNLASLNLHKEELEVCLAHLDFEFDIIAVTETKIKKSSNPIFDLTLNGYKYYQTPTESAKGGVLIYVKENINIKRRTDLENLMYKSRELESVFIEILNEGMKNEIFGCV